MTRLSYPLRFVALLALSSLSLLILCASMAIFLYRMQTVTAEALGENIVSRQAASDLNDSLAQLADRLREGNGDVEHLHKKIKNDLDAISEHDVVYVRTGSASDGSLRPGERVVTGGSVFLKDALADLPQEKSPDTR